ncbi:MAG: 50S ribosomal protein L11 methyltransferase [Candidatus Binatia bacterium]|nr:50S ribosomal protein L11 methyltransferase [Candidatus Binatia bacterium]
MTPEHPPSPSTALLAQGRDQSLLSSGRWLCVSVSVPVEAAETVASLLIALGSAGAIESIQEAPSQQGPTTTVQGFFPVWTDRAMLSDALTSFFRDTSVVLPHGTCPSPCFTEITDEAWSHSWRVHFPPLMVGDRFVVLPPWDTPPDDTERLVLIIDPGMAFGTGQHATTQSCLQAIETLARRVGIPSRALDVGTGSGILAIALAKLGVPSVWATDVDPLAIEEARKNIALNHVESQVMVSDLTPETLPGPFSLVVANLLAATLVTLAPSLRAATVPGGHAILSGVLREQEAAVRTAYGAPHWQDDFCLTQDEWVTIVLHRREQVWEP